MRAPQQAGKTAPAHSQAKSARIRCSAATVSRHTNIGPELMLDSTPGSLLRSVDSQSSTKARFEKVIRSAQDSICKAIEEIDGTKFREDAWVRADGGGGITRVMQNGNVWEKAGVNVSVVYGSMPAEAYRAASANPEVLKSKETSGRVPFFAAGISSVMHPHNPHAPTMHFNYRYFETEEWAGIPGQWWFGGGTDITPAYLYDEDMKHFHGVYKQVCDRHDPAYYPKFKQWADDYFLIKHRDERRGLGGIFFDDLNNKPQDEILAFSEDAVNHVVEAYCPLVKKHKDDAFTPEQKEWQAIRRGRYVEFNLVYDRGTTFGLKTGGRIESILMSLPVHATWLYDNQPKEGSPEWNLLDACKKPRNWV